MLDRHPSRTSAYRALVSQIARDEVVFLVGDLVYQGTGVPTRAEVARRLAADCAAPPNLLRLPDVGQFFATSVGPAELRSAVRRIYDEASREILNPPVVIAALARLPATVIATINYDGWLERACVDGTYDAVLTDVDVAYHEKGRRLIVALHGRVNRPESLVVTKDEHYGFTERYELLNDVLRAHIVLRTPVLLGCDLADPYLVPFFRKVARGMGEHARRAYAIQPEVSEYDIEYWREQNLTIVQADPLEVLAAAQRAVSDRSPSRTSPRNQVRVRRNLFKFLAAFEEVDADRFFGRREDVDQLLPKIASSSLVILHSRSGAGKTSLIRAGLAPALEATGYRVIYLTAWRDPVAQLAELLGVTDGEHGDRRTGVLGALMALNASGTRLVVFIDQFEQFFVSATVTSGQQADLVEIVERCVFGQLANVRFVVSLREDFLADMHDMQQRLHTTFANLYRLHNLTLPQAREAIEGPLRVGKLTAAEDLVAVLLEDLAMGSGEVYPPQLQIVCDKLFNPATDRTTVNEEVLRAHGGVRGILANYVTEVLRSMSGGTRAGAKAVLKALVSSHRTRTKIGLKALSARVARGVDVPAILDLLQDHRLVRRDDDGGTTYYELTHEYVIEEISNWITEEEYTARRAQELVEQEFYNWTEDTASFMSRERFGFINAERQTLRLDVRAREFLFLTALHLSTDLDYWVHQVDLSDPEFRARLITELDSPVPSRRRNAAVVLAYHADRVGNSMLSRSCLSILTKIGNPYSLQLVTGLGAEAGLQKQIDDVVRRRYRSKMVEVPGGTFIMGSTAAELDWVSAHFDIPRGWIEKEMPQHTVELETFYIDAYPTTNSEFAEFDPAYTFPDGHDDHPAVNMDWQRARQYAAWIGKRLPTEAEWEKAARGTDGRRFPWGDEYDVRFANSKESAIGTTTPVGAFPDGASPYGCHDMAGNVFEWTSSLAAAYPYRDDGRENPAAPGTRILRGGAFSYNYSLLRCALRYDYYSPSHSSSSLGLRCALGPDDDR